MTELSDERIRTNCLMILTAAVVLFMLYWLRPVLAPFVVALFVVSGITPVLFWLESRLKVNRVIASLLTLALGVLLMGLLGMSFTASAVELGSQAPAYVQRVQNLVLQIDERLPIGLFDTISATDAAAEGVAAEGVAEATTENEQAEDPRQAQFAALVERIAKEAITLASQWFATSVSTGLIVLIYVAFLIFGDIDKLARNETWRVVDGQIRSYIGLKAIVSLITGLAFGFALWCFGVPMAVTFGVLAFLLNFIPNIGPLVASVLPLPFILLAPDGTLLWMIVVIVVTSGIQLLSGYVVEAKVMGDSANLHPVVILLSLVFWGMLWGLTGMFLAVPIAAASKIIMERFRPTRWVARLMAGELPDLEQFRESLREEASTSESAAN